MDIIEYKPLSEFKAKTNLVKIILFKPKLAPIVCSVVGIAFCIFVPELLARILGMFFVLMALAVIFLIPEHKVMDIYEDGMLIYNPKNSEQAFFLSYDEVTMWKIEHTDGHDVLELTLNDMNKVNVDTFQIDAAYKTLDKFMHDKEYHVIQAKKSKEKPLVFTNWIKERFNKTSNDEPSSKD